MYKIVIIIFVSTICLSCNSGVNTKSIFLNDLDTDTIVVFKLSKKYPTTLKIHVNSNTSDSFFVNYVKVGPGKVDTFWHSDWYRNVVTINCQPSRPLRGEIKIECSGL